MQTVLLVDDEPEMRKVYRAALDARFTNLKVLDVSHGPEALDILRVHPVDLVISDIMNAEMGGLGLLREALVIDPTLVFVFVTGYGKQEHRDAAQKGGTTT